MEIMVIVTNWIIKVPVILAATFADVTVKILLFSDMSIIVTYAL